MAIDGGAFRRAAFVAGTHSLSGLGVGSTSRWKDEVSHTRCRKGETMGHKYS